VEEDLSDVHKHSVPRGHRRQVQPQLHVVHRVAAQVLQLHTRTRANAHAPTHVQMHGHTHTHTHTQTFTHVLTKFILWSQALIRDYIS
jgi:hypothetical protein